MLCFLSSHINYQSSNFCSPRPPLLALRWWKHLVWSHTCHCGLLWDEFGHHWSFYWLCYYFYRSEFHKSDWSPRKFTSFMNCILRSLALLLKLVIIFTDLTFIGVIGLQGNSFYSCNIRSVLLFIWTQMQSWLLDYLATNLDLSTISWLHTIKKDCLLTEN